MLSHKGYKGNAEFDADANTYFGSVVNSTAIIAFRGSTMSALDASFRDCVDTYLEACAEDGTPPEPAFAE